jgi:hypothetical protein
VEDKREIDMSQVLKLNAAWQPIELIPWEDAITLWFAKKVEVIASYKDHVVRSAGDIAKVADTMGLIGAGNLNIHSNTSGTEEWRTAMHMPAVVRLFEFVRPKHRVVFYKPFTRKNLWERDGGRCQYCGCKLSLSQLTYEHVIPKDKGGVCRWENIVAACTGCNSKKRNRTPAEAGMVLIRKPFAPVLAHDYGESVANRFKQMSKAVLSIEEWRSYCYFNVELESEKEPV